MNAKKRILFVDDEAMILQGLRRMLRPWREEWDMVFVDNGPAALELMAQSAFDVVVSDMRMPGMNGAELLNEVMRRYPQTIRLILSGHADQDLILKCVGSTHQYLSKPCDAEALKAVLQRAMMLEGSLNDAQLKQLVARIERVPSIPSIYTEIVDLLHQPETGVEEVGAVIAKDLGMTAKILQLVNSAFFGLRRQITGPAEAVSYLGLETVKSLVLSLNAFSQFEGVEIPGFSLEALWTHSLETATLAKAIATAEGSDRQVRDEAFVAGMLHDVGKLVMVTNFTPHYAETLRLAQDDQRAPLEAERQVFGAHHASVGGYLLGLWGLPVPVAEAITLHHAPQASPNSQFSSLTAVHAANVLAHERSPSGAQSASTPLDMDYLSALGLAERVDVWRALELATSAQAA